MKAKWLLWVLVLVMVAAVGCSPAPAAEPAAAPAADAGGKVKIGYCVNNMNDTFQTYIVDAAQAWADANNVELVVVDAKEDMIAQQDVVNGLITQGVAGLVVVPVDTSAMSPVTKAASEAGLPLVYVNRNPYAESEVPAGVYYVGSQEIDAGVMQMEYLGELAGGSGGVGILQGLMTNEGAVKRTEGNEQAIKEKYSGMSVLAKEPGDWQRDQGMEITENWITTYGDELKVICANNDEMALGAVRACEQLNRTDILIGGVDGIPDAIAAVKAGQMACSVLQDAVGQGEGAMKAIVAAVNGETPESITWVPFQLITPDNVADFE